MSLNISKWKEFKIEDLFKVSVSKDNNLQNSNKGSTAYISSSCENNGLTAFIDSEPSQKANTITIARNGSVGSTFYQPQPYCCSPDDIRILTPKFKLNVYNALFLKTIIEKEKFKYTYGRKLGTARIKKLSIRLPINSSEKPDWEYMETYIKSLKSKPITTRIKKCNQPIDVSNWKEFTLGELFTIKYGINLELQKLQQTDEHDVDAVNFVARTAGNNGVTARVKRIPEIEPQPSGILTCAGGGSVLSTFVQNKEFYSGRDLYLLYPKYDMDIFSKLFCCTLIKSNKYRYAYGRQANKTMPYLTIKLPQKKDGLPNFDKVSEYMKQLPYSDRIFV